jgi:hypothetical protein
VTITSGLSARTKPHQSFERFFLAPLGESRRDALRVSPVELIEKVAVYRTPSVARQSRNSASRRAPAMHPTASRPCFPPPRRACNRRSRRLRFDPSHNKPGWQPFRFHHPDARKPMNIRLEQSRAGFGQILRSNIARNEKRANAQNTECSGWISRRRSCITVCRLSTLCFLV